tara:strand:- start:759 stop:1130 length:372 start_codon:yes stop_codon:yes gene_type:complete
MSCDNKTFQENIIQWLEYDNQIKTLNETLKTLRGKKNGLESGITLFIEDKEIIDKSIHVPSFKSNIKYSEQHTYENISLRYVKDCLSNCIDDDNQIKTIMDYIKNKRLRKTKVTIKRDILTDD